MLTLTRSTFSKLLLTSTPLLIKQLNRLPFSLKSKVLALLLNQAFNQAIQHQELDFLQQRWLKIHVTDLELSYFFSLSGNELVTAERSEADVCFSGDSQSLLLLASKAVDPDTLFFQRKLSISGDTELGLEIKNLLDSLEFESLPLLLRSPLQLGQKIFSDPM